MIEQEAVVSSREGNHVWVETQRDSACNSCNLRGGCGTSLLGKALGSRRSLLRVQNDIGVRAGERVIVGLSETAVLSGALALYAIPLACMMGFAIAARILFEAVAPTAAEPISIGAGAAGLAAGLLWLRRFARRAGNDPRFKAVLLRRTGEAAEVGFPRR